jgi:hypothetical protein
MLINRWFEMVGWKEIIIIREKEKALITFNSSIIIIPSLISIIIISIIT